MYVCLCNGVSDHDIRETIAEGACSVEEVAYCTGAGTKCGSCVSAVAKLLDEHAEAKSHPAHRLRVLTSAA